MQSELKGTTVRQNQISIAKEIKQHQDMMKNSESELKGAEDFIAKVTKALSVEAQPTPEEESLIKEAMK